MVRDDQRTSVQIRFSMHEQLGAKEPENSVGETVAIAGQELRMRVIKVNKKRGNIVLSRRVLLEKEREEIRKETLERMEEGVVLEGIDLASFDDWVAQVDHDEAQLAGASVLCARDVRISAPPGPSTSTSSQ